MTGTNRRTFLMKSTAALSSLAVSSCTPAAEDREGVELPEATLRAVGRSVLPSELGPERVERVLLGFDHWLEEYEPVTELDHGYISSEIRYGSPDPAPRWQAQLEALELESRKRHKTPFVDLSGEDRGALVRRQIGVEGDGSLPESPATASHVAVGILSYFYNGSEATDLCYGRKVGKVTCRGIATAPETPDLLEGGA